MLTATQERPAASHWVGLTREDHQAATLHHYSQTHRNAALRLYNIAEKHLGTSGGNTCVKLLLGLYNGERFPFDLTDLRLLDEGNLTAAMVVLHMDAAHTYCEIHVLLDAILGLPLGQSTGHMFEHWAYDMRLKGACKKAQLPSLKGVRA